MRDYQLRFFLLDLLVLLQVVVQVRPATELKYGAKTIMVDLYSVVVLNNAPVVQFLVDLVLAQRMLDVIVLDLITPTVIKMMNFASNFSAVLQVKGLVDLRKATFAKNG